MTEHNSIKILALLGLAFMALCVPRLDAQEVVYITDENLEAAIRDVLGIPTDPITDIDLFGLTELQADVMAITDLTGLQYCVNLTVLSLANNNISDLEPLSRLKNLTELNLSGNNISQVKPLSRLRNLTSLCLSYNNISDIGPLSRFTNLRFLYLHSNPLDFDAYLTFIPLITENNPGVDIFYDLLPPESS